MSYSFKNEVHRSKRRRDRAVVHEFITAGGKNSIAWTVDDLNENFESALDELMSDWGADEFFSREVGRRLLAEYHVVAKDALSHDDPTEYVIDRYLYDLE